MERKKPQNNGLRNIFIDFSVCNLVIIALALFSRFTPKNSIDTYEGCVKEKSSRIVESYPSVCVTANKQSFVNTAQQRTCGPFGYTANPNLCR
jgi:hypothetical protein